MRSGALVAGTKLLWPQTEYHQGLRRARRMAATMRRRAPRSRAHLALIAKHFMRPDGASWHNQLARDGTPLTPATPARVLYHLFLAVAEVDRLLNVSAPSVALSSAACRKLSSPANAFW